MLIYFHNQFDSRLYFLRQQLHTVPQHCFPPGTHIPATAAGQIGSQTAESKTALFNIQRGTHTSFTTSDNASRRQQNT